METKKVRFSKIKPGSFFRIKGRTLYQRCKGVNDDAAQVVTGPKIGESYSVGWGLTTSTLVTPVNAFIVEEK